MDEEKEKIISVCYFIAGVSSEGMKQLNDELAQFSDSRLNRLDPLGIYYY